MAEPTGYTITYSFNGFQAINPDAPLPASDLDNEFTNVKASLDSIIAAVGDVRRADGNLENDVVTWDALSADVQAKIDNVDNRVVIGDINPAAFATQVEAEAGVASDKISTPLNVKQALDALRTLATQLQAQAGTDNAAVMTPLRTKEQLDALRKLTDKATAEAGANNTEVMTPLRTKEQLDALRKAFTNQVQLTWGSIAAAGTAEQSVTVSGAVVGDRVVLGLVAAGIDAGLISEAWVSAADTVKIRLTNITAAPITPHGGAATNYDVTALRF